MPFHLKVTYDGVTRKVPVVNKPIPSFDELLNQVRGPFHHSFVLSPATTES